MVKIREFWRNCMTKASDWKQGFLKSIHHDLFTIWIRSRRCGCLVTWFCYHLIAKPGNKTAAPSWPDPYLHLTLTSYGVITSQITGNSTCLFNHLFTLTAKKIPKLCITGPLWGESTTNRWIPLTKGQKYGKSLYVMVATWNPEFHKTIRDCC